MPGDPVLRLVDARAGGDVSRVIISGGPALEGRTAAEQCADFSRRYDHLRRKLIDPPHGALHMCPVLLLPRSATRDFGAIIMESMGYPPISGSNLFCATAVALEHGFAAIRGPETPLKVEVPAGLVPVTAFCRDGRCHRVAFRNTPARVGRVLALPGPGRQPVEVTVVRAGVDYAVVDAGTLGVALSSGCEDRLVGVGIELTAAAGTDFVLFHETPHARQDGIHCVVAVFQSPAVICRSPTGTGTSAMLALIHARGGIGPGATLTTRSPAGGEFTGRIEDVRGGPEGPAVDTVIAGDVTTGPPVTIG